MPFKGGAGFSKTATFKRGGFPAAVGAPPAPTVPPIAGYIAWYDASQIKGVTNGAALTTWPDASGTGNTLVPAAGIGGATGGIYRTNQLNALPGVEFAVNAAMASAAFVGGAIAIGTIFIVANSIQTSLGGGSGNNYLFDGISAGSRWAMGQAIIAGGDMTIFAGTGVSGYAESVPSGFAQWTASFAGTAASNLRKNGSAEFTGNVGTDTLTGITLGESYAGADLGLSQDVKICEVIIYPTVLSGANILSVEGYLDTKWAL